MSEPINEAGNIPVSAPTPVVSVSSVVLSAPGRAVDLQMRVSAPVIRKRAAGHPSLARPWPCERRMTGSSLPDHGRGHAHLQIHGAPRSRQHHGAYRDDWSRRADGYIPSFIDRLAHGTISLCASLCGQRRRAVLK